MQRRQGRGLAGELRQPGGVQPGQGRIQPGQHAQRQAQLAEIPWPRRAQGHPRQNPLHVADAPQQRGDPLVAVLLEQGADGVLAQAQRGAVAQRALQPAGQQPRAHGGGGLVQHCQQGVLAPPREVDRELQVAAGGRVENDALLPGLGAQGADVGQGAALGVLGVLQQTAGCAHRQGQVGAAEGVQVAGAELGAELPGGGLRVEVPGRLAGGAEARLQETGLQLLVHQQLGGLQPLQLAEQRLPALHLQHLEAAAGDVQARQAVVPVVAGQRHQQVVPALLQQGLVADGAGGDHAHHLALHRPLGGGGIADLLADGHRLAQPHQAAQVALHRVHGHARHGNRRPRRLAPGGQGDVQQLRHPPGVVVEQLVEIAHAVEQQPVGLLRLDAQVLLHHRRVAGEVLHCLGHGGAV